MNKPDGMSEEAWRKFLATPVQFWICINREHRDVTWKGDVAHCDTCGLTSEMTRAYATLARQVERDRIVTKIRKLVTEDSSGLFTEWRDFVRRSPRLTYGDAPMAVLHALADEIEEEA